MVVIVEPGPKTPVRGILSRPIVSPTKLELTDAQIKRAILSGGNVFRANSDGSKTQITFSNGELHTGEAAVVEQPVEEAKPVEPVKEEPAAPVHKSKAQRREEERLAREAAQRAAREKAEAERLAKEEAARKAEEERLAAEAAAEEVVEESETTEDEELAEIERMIAEEEAAKEAAEVVEE